MIEKKEIFFRCYIKFRSEMFRADHVIVQSYEEESADHRLFVAIFIKDPYRQTIALTNDQFLLALKRYQQDIYQDIKHQV